MTRIKFGWYWITVARVLAEWSSVSRIFHHPARPHLDELELSRTLELAAAALSGDEPILRSPRGARFVPNRQRLAAVAVLGERETQLSAVQRLALPREQQENLKVPRPPDPSPAILDRPPD